MLFLPCRPLNTVVPRMVILLTENFEIKQVLVVRTDLGMGRGKMAVQCSHAAVSSAELARTRFRDWYDKWMREGQAKIALKVKDEDQLLELEKRARGIPIPSFIVRDMGLTQVQAGTITCLGLGPAPVKTVDILTGKLRLL